MLKSDNPMKSYSSLHISHRGRLGVSSPQTSFFILIYSPWTQIMLRNLTLKLALRFKAFCI